jgi:hypothetical protein
MQINAINILFAAFILDFILKISSNLKNESQNNNNVNNNNNYEQTQNFYNSKKNNDNQKPSMKISENNEEIKIKYDTHKKQKINKHNFANNYENNFQNKKNFNEEILKNDIYLKIQYCQS